MDKSIAQTNKEQFEAYNTQNNTLEMFPISSKVRVICYFQDMYFFDPDTQNTYGTVIRHSCDMIIVKWDYPRHYQGGYVQETFNFEPEDLILIEPVSIYSTKDAERRNMELE
jgi:hypothetical protein